MTYMTRARNQRHEFEWVWFPWWERKYLHPQIKRRTCFAIETGVQSVSRWQHAPVASIYSNKLWRNCFITLQKKRNIWLERKRKAVSLNSMPMVNISLERFDLIKRRQKVTFNHFTPKSDFIDFTLSNARRFNSSKGNPLGVKGL